MGMDLYSVKDEKYFRWTKLDWKRLLELALQYDWHASGAVTKVMVDGEVGLVVPILKQAQIPSYLDIGGAILSSYEMNCGLLVMPEDACNLANALERALPDIPNAEAIEHKAPVFSVEGWSKDETLPAEAIEVSGLPPDPPPESDLRIAVGFGEYKAMWRNDYLALNVWETFAGRQQKVLEFIEYCCESDGFQIC